MEQQIRRVVECLARNPRVVAVYLFGSIAREEAHPGSDVDLALLTDGKVTLDEELELRAVVSEELQRGDVDLVFLAGAPPVLRHEVIAAGRRLFTRDEGAADAFEERSIQEYLDTAWLRKVQRSLAAEHLR